MPAAIGGSSPGNAICESASNARSEASVGCGSRVNASGLATGVRLMNA